MTARLDQQIEVCSSQLDRARFRQGKPKNATVNGVVHIIKDAGQIMDSMDDHRAGERINRRKCPPKTSSQRGLGPRKLIDLEGLDLLSRKPGDFGDHANVDPPLLHRPGRLALYLPGAPDCFGNGLRTRGPGQISTDD